MLKSIYILLWTSLLTGLRLSSLRSYLNPLVVSYKLTAQSGVPEYYYFLQPEMKEILKDEVQGAVRELQRIVDVLSSNATSFHPTEAVRAVAGYMPPHISKFYRELKSLYLSVALMRLHQPLTVKTDLLIFINEVSRNDVEAIGCTDQHRISFKDTEKCIYVISSAKTSAEYFDPLSTYPNAKSVDFLLGMDSTYSYDFVLRTDLDVFITPGFADWIPTGPALLYTGQGGYGSINARNHLKWVAQTRLGLMDAGLSDIGSTWYGRKDVVVVTAKVSVAVMRWLHTQEFSEYEICCSGVDGWPHWHWGVLSMYSGHIAVNQLDPSVVVVKNDSEYVMDYFSDSSADLDSKIKHVHVWHTDKRYSKFAMETGQYKNLNLTEFLNMTSARDYATVIAVSADRLSADEFRSVVADPQGLANKSWLKVFP